MAHEEDECDSSSLCPITSQSDLSTYLQVQTKRTQCLSRSDDETNSCDENFERNLTKDKSTFLSQSCFASISTQKQSINDDLTELKWLNTFQFKQFQHHPIKDSINKCQTTTTNHDQISQMIHDLKIYNNEISQPSFSIIIFLCFYSKNTETNDSWELNQKEIYDYIKKHFKSITNQRGWKNSIKQTLLNMPCFQKRQHNTKQSRLQWTIDSYYRPLLIKAYLTNLNKIEDKQSESIVDSFAPKATVKTKVLPRLYERLCGEKLLDDESDSNAMISHLNRRKRARSASLINQQYQQSKDDKCRQRKLMKNDQINLTRKSTMTTRSQTINRRKSSPPKKHFISHRPNTRMSRKIIEEDLQLLRQAQPLDLSNNKISCEHVLDLEGVR